MVVEACTAPTWAWTTTTGTSPPPRLPARRRRTAGRFAHCLLVSDIIFGTPTPVKSTANLGIWGPHRERARPRPRARAVRDARRRLLRPEVRAYAQAAGAEGITLAGICCTANEILMRHGIIAQLSPAELAIVTGAVEMMLIDVQCCIPGLPTARSYHTEGVSTSAMAKTVGASETVQRTTAYETAKGLLSAPWTTTETAIRKRWPSPATQKPRGGVLRGEHQVHARRHVPRVPALERRDHPGAHPGIAGIVGCNNPKSKLDSYINTLTRELLRENVLVLKTGCAAIASAKEGNLTPEAAFSLRAPA